MKCRDNTYYTGITTDLSRRLREHNSLKRGARYTRSRQPVELIYHEPAQSRSEAACREHQIRKLSLTQKKALVEATLVYNLPTKAAIL